MSESVKKQYDCGALLIVDDDPINRAILENIFEPHYDIREAQNGAQGLEMILAGEEGFCAVLLDVVMPEMDGLQMLRRLNERNILQQLPVFLITAETSTKMVREAYGLGVMDVITKPVVPYVVLRRVQSVIELFQARRRLGQTVVSQQEKLLEQARQLKDMSIGMVEALATAIEFRSEESGDHVRRIHDITWQMLANTEMGSSLSYSQIEEIAMASILHDVGKIAVPDAILNKPGKLTPEEFEIMKGHTVQGAALIEKVPQLHDNGAYDYAIDIARHHHERWDGRGYPDGLRGEEITVWSQVVSLADVYDALRCKRVYKEAYPREQVLKMIKGGECGEFNPQLLDCFFSVEGKLSELY